MVISRAKGKKPGLRNPPVTQSRILEAAKHEFARNGLGGARIDTIAKRARTNKRMMYHYFGNKEALFTRTVEDAYARFRDAEASLELDKLEPAAALRRFIEFAWSYFLANPEFITLVNSENLHRARHIKASERMRAVNRAFVARMESLLVRGAAAGVFRSGIDAVQLHISIAAVGYYYLTNRFTGAIVFERDLMSREALAARLAYNLETILRSVCTAAALAQQGYET